MPKRLGNCLPSWEAITQDRFVLSVIRHGYRVPFDASLGPPPAQSHPNHASCKEHSEFVNEALAEALRMGVVKRVPEWFPHLVLPLGVVVQNVKKRLIADLRVLNENTENIPFKFENLETQGRAVFGGKAFGYALDLRKAFYHFDIHPEYTKYFGFRWEELAPSEGELRSSTFVWCQVPFGAKLAPHLLTKTMQAVSKYWRSTYGFNFISMMDDVTGGALSAAEAKRHVTFMIWHLQKLGFLVQHEKTQGLERPVTKMLALGTLVDFDQQLYSMGAKRTKSILDALVAVHRPNVWRPRLHVRLLAKLAGLIIASMISLGASVRIRTRALYAAIVTRLYVGEDVRSRKSWDRNVTISHEAKAEIKWWLNHLLELDGRALATAHPSIAIEALTGCDAGALGFGGWLSAPPSGISHTLLLNIRERAPLGFTFKQAVRAGKEGLQFTCLFPPDIAADSSTCRELYGARWLLHVLLPLLKNLSFQLQLDNQGCVQILGGRIPAFAEAVFGGSRKPHLQKLAVELLDDLERVGSIMTPIWVPRDLNTRADWLSHAREMAIWGQYDFTLERDSFKFLDSRYGGHTIDRMASGLSSQLPRFNSQWFEPDCEWVDCFAVPWQGENNYVFAPPALVPRVLNHMRLCGANGTLVILEWTGQVSWPMFYPKGSRGGPAPFVRDVVQLGWSTHLLSYPRGSVETGADEAAHLPRGNLLAVRCEFE
jgi:hypothetical protein